MCWVCKLAATRKQKSLRNSGAFLCLLCTEKSLYSDPVSQASIASFMSKQAPHRHSEQSEESPQVTLTKPATVILSKAKNHNKSL